MNLAIKSIEQRMTIEEEWLIASILDPAQVKSNLVFSHLEKRNTTLRDILIKFIQQTEIEDILNDSATSSNTSTNMTTVQEIEEMGPAKRLRLEMLQELDSDENSDMVCDNSIEKEIDQYLFIAATYPKNDDVLLFWKQNKETLPHLYSLARKILGLSLTSSFCEHAFSLSGALLNKKRSKLNPVRAHKQLFVNANYNLYASQRQN